MYRALRERDNSTGPNRSGQLEAQTTLAGG